CDATSSNGTFAPEKFYVRTSFRNRRTDFWGFRCFGSYFFHTDFALCFGFCGGGDDLCCHRRSRSGNPTKRKYRHCYTWFCSRICGDDEFGCIVGVSEIVIKNNVPLRNKHIPYRLLQDKHNDALL